MSKKVLIAGEYSGRVRDAFIAEGHQAISCDFLPTESPGPHYQGDVRDILHEDWDMMIAFPSCKFLAQTGSQWLYHKEDSPSKKPGLALAQRRPHPRHPHRREQRAAAIEFFMLLATAPIPQICIENPIGCMSKVWRKPDQIVQPWWFGDEASKKTCLWLKNLPLLQPTDIVGKGEYVIQGGHRFQAWYSNLSRKERSKRRALIFPGMARAMARQFPGTSPQDNPMAKRKTSWKRNKRAAIKKLKEIGRKRNETLYLVWVANEPRPIYDIATEEDMATFYHFMGEQDIIAVWDGQLHVFNPQLRWKGSGLPTMGYGQVYKIIPDKPTPKPKPQVKAKVKPKPKPKPKPKRTSRKKSRLSAYQKFVSIERRRGYSFEEIGRMWREG